MHLHTLGSLHLEGRNFNRPKPLLLLAYLALEGSKARRYVAELFFMDTRDPLNSLSRSISYLREESPELIGGDSQQIATSIACDAAELLDLANAQAFEQCCKLYQGAFAEYVNLPLGEELEEWLYGTREILAANARNAFIVLSEQEAAKGNFSQAALLAEKAYKLKEAAELEPDDFGRLYSLLYAGNSPLAAEVRKEAEGFEIPLELSREVATAQASEVNGVIHNIPNNLPPPKTSFVGRDQELVGITQQLSKKDCRLLTLHGMGGIGKSRLALQATYDQIRPTKGFSPLFTDGVYFVALDALTSAELIPSSIAEALSLELQGQEDTLTQVKRFIGKKHILLLLDNYEHLMAGATLTSKLLEVCPNLKLLVTSRERLNVEEEWVLTLDGLAVPTSTELSEVERFDALNLFVQRAKRAMLEFSLSQETLPHALKICQLVEGSPLGIELAAVWVKTLPVSEIAKEIESNLSILEAPTKNVAERHQSIGAAFEHSWKLLSDKEQEVLRKLSVFVGGFRREAAAEIAGATLPILASLVNKSLLRVSENGRYDRHPLLYEFAKEKLNNQSTEKLITATKHATYFSNFLNSLSEENSNNKQNEAVNIMGEELRNIEEAFNWLAFNDQFGEKEANNDLYLYFIRRAKFQEGIAFFSKIILHLNEDKWTQKTAKAILMIYQALLHYDRGEYAEAEELTQKSLITFSKIGNPGHLNLSQTVLGMIAEVKGEFKEAKTYYERALENAMIAENLETIAALQFNLSQLALILGNYSSSEEYALKALKIFKEVENPFGEANALTSLGETKLKLNQKEEGLRNLLYALEIAKRIDYRALIGYLQNALAKAYLVKGDLATALTLCNTALEVVKQSGEQTTEGMIYRTLGEIALKKGELREASENLHLSFLIARKEQHLPELQAAFVGLSKLFLKTENFEEASHLLTIVLSHPSSIAEDRHEAKQLLIEIQNRADVEFQPRLSNPSKLETIDIEEMIEKALTNLSNFSREGVHL